MVEDFVVKDVIDTGDRIVLHLNVFKMLLDEESQDAQVLRQMLSFNKVSFEKTLGVLREHHFMYMDSLCPCDQRKKVKLVILCCFDPSRWEQLLYLDP